MGTGPRRDETGLKLPTYIATLTADNYSANREISSQNTNVRQYLQNPITGPYPAQVQSSSHPHS